MMVRKRATIIEVAKAAGVSPQTVSRVINDHPDVAEQTRARVQRSIDQLNYRPNILARSLIRRRSKTLGVVAMASAYYGPSTTLVGIEQMTRRLGYSLLLDFMHHPERDDVEAIVNRMLSHQVDGILWAVPEINSNRRWLNRKSTRLPVPAVFLSMQAVGRWPVAAVDNDLGGRLAANHFLALGYQRMGIITGPLTWWEARSRLAGWQSALEHAGLPAGAHQMVEGDWSASSGDAAMRLLWDRYPEVQAVFACNDQMALGVLQAAHRTGRKVPEELAVIGFDNIPESACFWPSLTTIDQPLVDLGGQAVEMLIHLIDEEQAGIPLPSFPPRQEAPSSTAIGARTLQLPPSLIERESSKRNKSGGYHER
jgi:LacI family transcriptional regulator